jgi:hypothetical protein
MFEKSYEELQAEMTEAHWTLVRAVEKSDEWTILSARENFNRLRKEIDARRIEKPRSRSYGSTDL